MNKFYQEHGLDVVSEILKGMPFDATHFVYAYVAKSIDYIKYDGETVLVMHQGQWKVIVAQYLIDSFKDMVHSLSELKDVYRSHVLVNGCGGLVGAYEKLDFYERRQQTADQFISLRRAILVVEGKCPMNTLNAE